MKSLTPIIIGRWADEPEDDEYGADACQNCEEEICQTGVSTVHVEQLKTVAAALLEDSSEATKQQRGCDPFFFLGTPSSCYFATIGALCGAALNKRFRDTTQMLHLRPLACHLSSVSPRFYSSVCIMRRSFRSARCFKC